MSAAVGSNTSVHMGCFTNDYSTVLTRDPDADLTYSATGVSACLLSNRMSWFYDFKGPSLTLDTACSSSLNAVHLGSASLRSGEVNMAVVGGCNLFCKLAPSMAPGCARVVGITSLPESLILASS